MTSILANFTTDQSLINMQSIEGYFKAILQHLDDSFAHFFNHNLEVSKILDFSVEFLKEQMQQWTNLSISRVKLISHPIWEARKADQGVLEKILQGSQNLQIQFFNFLDQKQEMVTQETFCGSVKRVQAPAEGFEVKEGCDSSSSGSEEALRTMREALKSSLDPLSEKISELAGKVSQKKVKQKEISDKDSPRIRGKQQRTRHRSLSELITRYPEIG
jgi:hypothetical protein